MVLRRIPGFIDAHSHDDLALLSDPAREVKRKQGIVHQVIGNCGLTPFPLAPGRAPEYERFLASVLGETGVFTSARDFLSRLQERAPGSATAFVGYNSLRAGRFGLLDRPLDAEERREAARAVGAALDEGCRGVSIGLAYLPAVAADATELEDLCHATPLFTVHMRNESDRLLDSLEEVARAIRSARSRGAKTHLHISHLKIAGPANWPLRERLLATVARLREELGVTFDHYPFAFGSTGLAALLHPRHASLPPERLRRVAAREIEATWEEPGWENYLAWSGPERIVLAEIKTRPELDGKRLSEVRELVGGRLSQLAETIRDLVAEEPGAAILLHGQSEEVIDELLRLPYGCVGSDALPAVSAHPRLTSTFPVYLERARRVGLSFDEAVRKASILPREIFVIENATTIEVEETTPRSSPLPSPS